MVTNKRSKEECLGQVEMNEVEREVLNHAWQDQLDLFQKHIGPYQDVIDAAFSHVNMIFGDEIFYDDTVYSYDRGLGRYTDPKHHMREGPHPDLQIWLGLFCGREEEQDSCDLYYKQQTERGGLHYEEIPTQFSPR